MYVTSGYLFVAYAIIAATILPCLCDDSAKPKHVFKKRGKERPVKSSSHTETNIGININGQISENSNGRPNGFVPNGRFPPNNDQNGGNDQNYNGQPDQSNQDSQNQNYDNSDQNSNSGGNGNGNGNGKGNSNNKGNNNKGKNQNQQKGAGLSFLNNFGNNFNNNNNHHNVNNYYESIGNTQARSDKKL